MVICEHDDTEQRPGPDERREEMKEEVRSCLQMIGIILYGVCTRGTKSAVSYQQATSGVTTKHLVTYSTDGIHTDNTV